LEWTVKLIYAEKLETMYVIATRNCQEETDVPPVEG
jgi:hypothetical protein